MSDTIKANLYADNWFVLYINGELVAVDVNRGEIAWKVPLGFVESLKAEGFGNTGSLNIGGSIATASGLIFIGATIDCRFRAFDSRTGKQLWETELPACAHTVPMTFLGKDQRQYVVVAAGGGVGSDCAAVVADWANASGIINAALIANAPSKGLRENFIIRMSPWGKWSAQQHRRTPLPCP